MRAKLPTVFLVSGVGCFIVVGADHTAMWIGHLREASLVGGFGCIRVVGPGDLPDVHPVDSVGCLAVVGPRDAATWLVDLR